MLALKLSLRSLIIRSAAIARGAWKLVNDTWRGETRKWSNIT